MSAPVKQVLCDHDWTEIDGPAADPSPYTADDNWATAFEFAGGVA